MFTHYSLGFVSYPTLALARSCKILSVMIGSLFIKSVKYHRLQYLSVFIIIAGILAFNYNSQSQTDSVIGLIFISLSLFCDGLGSYFAEFIKFTYHPHSLTIMNSTSKYNLISMVPITLISYTVKEPNIVDYMLTYPECIIEFFLFSLMSCIGQFFVFWGIKSLGTLNMSIITTSRKFVTFFVSILIYQHNIDKIQWFIAFSIIISTCLDLSVSYSKDLNKFKV